MKIAEKDTSVELPTLFDFQRKEALSVFITICTFSVLSFAGRGSNVNWGNSLFPYYIIIIIIIIITIIIIIIICLFVCLFIYLFIYLFRGTRENLNFTRNCYHIGVIRTSGPDSGLHLIMRLRPPHVDRTGKGYKPSLIFSKIPSPD